MYDIEVLRRSETDRRAFLARMTAAGLGAAAVALLAGCGSDSNNNPSLLDQTRTAFRFTSGGTTVAVPGNSQTEIVLNYALTLETLEADLYRQALIYATSSTATPDLTQPLHTYDPTPGSLQGYSLFVSPGTIGSTYQAAAFAYLVQFAYVEAAHRDYLRLTMASLNLTPAPLTPPTKYQFPTGTDFTSLSGILSAILPLEETGVRAYLGAGSYLSDNSILQAAVSIYSTEARHSASIEYILDPTGNTVGPRRNITGVPTVEFDVDPSPPISVADNVFEKALSPSNVLTGASTAYFA